VNAFNIVSKGITVVTVESLIGIDIVKATKVLIVIEYF
jgi:hypothetical protein